MEFHGKEIEQTHPFGFQVEKPVGVSLFLEPTQLRISLPHSGVHILYLDYLLPQPQFYYNEFLFFLHHHNKADQHNSMIA